MTELAQHSTAYDVVEGEPPEVLSRNLVAGSQLLASATAFFFLAFVFAYFYLRSVNNAGMWKPKHVSASVGWGAAVTACIVASAVLVWLGRRDQAAGRRAAWRLKGLIGIVLGMVSLVLQVLTWTHQSFGPADGGFASVYFGWTAFQFLWVLGSMLWLETALATSYRYRNEAFGTATVPPGHASGDSDRTGHDIRNPVALNTASLGALTFFWAFFAGIAALGWIVLYLI